MQLLNENENLTKNYLSMLVLKIIHVGKRGHWRVRQLFRHISQNIVSNRSIHGNVFQTKHWNFRAVYLVLYMMKLTMANPYLCWYINHLDWTQFLVLLMHLFWVQLCEIIYQWYICQKNCVHVWKWLNDELARYCKNKHKAWTALLTLSRYL